MLPGRRWSTIGLLFVVGCAGGHSTPTSSSSNAVRREPEPVAPVRFGSDPIARSAGVVKWEPTPASIVRVCRAAQARSSYPVLCPTVLPEAILGSRPGDPPPPTGAAPIPGVHGDAGVDIGYSAPTEAGTPHWKAHLWRNRPCCFLHLQVVRAAEVPVQTARRVVGGVSGRLALATGGYESRAFSGLGAFGNHVLFYFRRHGVSYLVSLHAAYRDGHPREYDNAATVRLLGVLVRHLRPAARLTVPTASTAETTTPTGSVGAVAIAATPSAVWVADSGAYNLGTAGEPRLIRIDTATGRVVARIAAGYLRGDVATGAGGIWAASETPGIGGVVVRVDPRTNRIVTRIRAGTWPRALAVVGNTVWVADSAPFYRHGELIRIDATTDRRVGRPLAMGAAPTAIAVADGALWVADAHDDVVRRVDTRTTRTVANIPVGRSPYAIVAAFGSLWVTNADDGTVSRIDPRTQRVVATIRLGGTPYGIAAGGREVWVANLGAGTIVGIDPANDHALPPVDVANDPLAIATAPTGLWVATDSEGTVVHLRSIR